MSQLHLEIKSRKDQNTTLKFEVDLNTIDKSKSGGEADFTNTNHPNYGVKLYTNTVNPNHVENKEEIEIFKDIYEDSEGGYIEGPFENDYSAAAIIKKVDGQQLDKYLEENKNNINEATLAKIYLAVIQGLEKVHNKNYVHSDAKLGNILISKDKDGNFIANFIDFGCTKKQGIVMKKAGGTDVFNPKEVRDCNPRQKPEDFVDVLYHKNQDYYHFTTSLLDFCAKKNIPTTFLVQNENDFLQFRETSLESKNREEQLYYFERFTQNYNPSHEKTPIFKLICPEPSKLDDQIIIDIKIQLFEVILKRPEAIDDKTLEQFKECFKTISNKFEAAITECENPLLKQAGKIFLEQAKEKFDEPKPGTKIEIIKNLRQELHTLEHCNADARFKQAISKFDATVENIENKEAFQNVSQEYRNEYAQSTTLKKKNNIIQNVIKSTKGDADVYEHAKSSGFGKDLLKALATTSYIGVLAGGALFIAGALTLNPVLAGAGIAVSVTSGMASAGATTALRQAGMFAASHPRGSSQPGSAENQSSLVSSR